MDRTPADAPARAALADGRPAVVAVVGAEPGADVPAAPLRAALGAAPDVAVVLLVPPGSADAPDGPGRLADLARAASACDATRPVLATARPVTDAVKRVDGASVRATVDRDGLRRAALPAAVERAHLAALLAVHPDAAAVPLLAGRVHWL